MAKEFLSEDEFSAAYRLAKPDFYYDGIIYYHKVEYAEGFRAEEAGIHQNQGFDQNQFSQDALHELAYLPAGEIPEQPSYMDRQVVIDGIMKEGQIIETHEEAEKPKAKRKAKKAEKKEEVAETEATPETHE